MLCGGVLSLVPEGTGRKLLRLVCGMILTLCVLGPISGAELPDSLPWPDTACAESIVERGKQQARLAVAERIKEQTEAYILDKADGLGAEVTVEITLTEQSPAVPDSAVIGGSVSPYVRGRLERILAQELGIPKERQQWTG